MERNLSFKVSVIIPVYGVERYVERCTMSLMEQTLSDVEFIFVDDCTPDVSMEIIRSVVSKYPRRCVKFLKHDRNKGITAARNTGLGLASGEYIYYCDSDDSLAPDMLEKLYGKAHAEDLDYVWCDFFVETSSGTRKEKTAEYRADKVEMMKRYLTFGWNVVWNTICRKKMYDQNGIRSMESISFSEDFELMTRLMFCAQSWGKVEEPLYYYNRLNSTSMVSTSISKAKLRKTIEDGICSVTSIAEFIRTHDRTFFDSISEVLYWNILNAKKFLCFTPCDRKRYMSIYPESHQYIESNPLCSRWHKMMQHMILNPLTAPFAWLVGIGFRLRHY